MTLLALCSLKGSPGVTTTALGLAEHWPTGHQPVVVECDPAGGDLLARFRLSLSPGLVSLAAAARRDTEPGLVWRHIQKLPGGLAVVAGPPAAEQARAALAQLTSSETTTFRRAADQKGAVVLADCGRIDASAPAMRVLRQADVLLLLARARDDAVARVASMVDAVQEWSPEPRFVLVGDGYRSHDVARELGIEVLARLPEDPFGAAALRGVGRRRATPARSALGKALTVLASQLADNGGGGSAEPSASTGPAARKGHLKLPAREGSAGHGNGAAR
ncbi:MinD/ParA family protein [Streptomyces sp. NPDC059009]|uniref:MinD/ParA family ATP-binding protein n=1 Tax=Streptomyces sp. NPDC059009 TaxID=3346694 RepID=UPI0036B6371A